MRFKKNVVIVFFIFIFVLLIGIFLKKNKDVVYKDISSNSKKYEIAYSEGVKTQHCNTYFGLGTQIFSHGKVKENYPMYVLNGCAVELSYFLEKTDLDKAACQTQREYAEDNIAWSYVVDSYNKLCNGITGELIVNYNGLSCEDVRTKIENNYIDYAGAKSWYDNNCISKTGEIKSSDIKRESYNLEAGNCERQRIFNPESTSFTNVGFTGILKSGEFPEGSNEQNKNTCPYPLFYINGYATTWEGYRTEGGNSTPGYNAYNYCDDLYNELKDSDNAVEINDYRVLCNENNIKTNVIPVPTRSCNYSSKVTSGNYDISNFKYDETNLTGCTSDQNKLPNTTIYDSLDDDIDWPLYLVQGCAWGIEDIIINKDNNTCITEEYKKEVCLNQKENVDLNNSDEVYQFNRICIDSNVLGEENRLKKQEYIYVYFKAPNSFGLECKNQTTLQYTSSTADTNKCVYKFKKELAGTSITLNTFELPNTTNLIQNLTSYSFNGWNKYGDTSCNKNSISFILPSDSTELIYEACYDGIPTSSLSYTLYETCDGTYRSGFLSATNEIKEERKTEKDLVINNSQISNTIISSKEYISTKNKTETISNGNSNFDINQYCKIGCREIFTYTYPSVFATVKSGTYFELLDYPSIYSEFVCDEVFDYNSWESAYFDSIKAEKIAYVNYLNSNTINNLTFEPISTCCLSRNDCNYDYYSTTDIYYEYNFDGTISSFSKSFGYCAYHSSPKSIARDYFSLSPHTNYYQSYKTAYDQRKVMEKNNYDCADAMTIPKVSTNKFYNIKNEDTKTSFVYESDAGLENYSIGSKRYYKEDFKISNDNFMDTGIVNYEGIPLDFNDGSYNVNYNISYDAAPNYSGHEMSFNAKKIPDSFMRKVTANYKFNHADKEPYYSDNHTGNINQNGDGIYLGYVYPLKLNLTGTRNVYFEIKVNTNLNYGASQILTSEKISDNRFKCTYDIVNDIIVEDTKTSVEDYKKNFYIRNISTQDVDPNDRYESGTLGSNWANEKGQELMEVIESKNESNNTYNPEYLEYSFTLNAHTIESIREYNKSRNYSDFYDFDCNSAGGECVSKFLSNLLGNTADGKSFVGGIEVSGVNGFINRNMWKYYIDGKWLLTKGISSNDWKDIKKMVRFNPSVGNCYNDSYINCTDNCEKKIYDCIYREINKGVLP